MSGAAIELSTARKSFAGSGSDEEHGSAPTTAFRALPDDGPESSLASSPPWFSDARRNTLVTSMYMSVAAILGCLLRIALAQLFGEGCKNPGSIGWLAAGEPLCITDVGRVTREGGVIFADLPANLLGSFIMGMMQTCAALGLPKNMPVPWIKASSDLQNWNILHLAIRTGFCGSLTTFSSWNSEMVIMIYGVGNNRRTQVGLALFGYLIGIETALGSFVFGKNVATWIYRWINPTLAAEAIASKEKEAIGVHVNRNLPDFERRFLPELQMEAEYCDPMLLQYLERWRSSTKESRLITKPEQLTFLNVVETKMLIVGEPLSKEDRGKAEALGWDIVALEAWVAGKNEIEKRFTYADKRPLYERLYVAGPIFVVSIGVFAFGVAVCNDETAVSKTYRIMWYSCLLAPLGALLRWKLSSLNGKLGNPWSWFPLGTLTANLLACIISISMIATELILRGSEPEWLELTFLAVKIGVAGCLSTVSTFISEVSGLMMAPSQYKGYKYVLCTLTSCCLVAAAIYGWIVYIIGEGRNDQ